jgi:hypothetical protein
MDMLPIKYKDVQIVYINRKKYAILKKWEEEKIKKK